jgi:hypothetical protein
MKKYKSLLDSLNLILSIVFLAIQISFALNPVNYRLSDWNNQLSGGCYYLLNLSQYGTF